MKFIIYTLLPGSVLLFPRITHLYFQHFMQFRSSYSFDIVDCWHAGAGLSTQWWGVLAVLRGFARQSSHVRRSIPWLPDAHHEAPTAGSVILAAVL